MVVCVFRMVSSTFILCVVISQISTGAAVLQQPIFSRSPITRDFDFSSEDVTSNPFYDQKNYLRTANNPKKLSLNLQENQQEPLSNILKEVGNSPPQKVYRKIYNESAGTRICWNTLTYVRDNNLVRGERFPWREYEVVFDSPSEDNSRKIEDSSNEIRSYKVKDPETGSVELLNFTVMEKNTNFTLSKHEKLTCGSGNFLTKIYYEWPRSNKKRVVVKLSDQPSDLSEDEELSGQNIEDNKGDMGNKSSDVENEEYPLKYRKNIEGGPRRSLFDDQSDLFFTPAGSKNRENELGSKIKFRMEAINGTNDDDDGDEENVLIKKQPQSADFLSRPLTNLEVSNILAHNRKMMNNMNDTKYNNTKQGRFNQKKSVQTPEDDFMDLTVGASVPKGVDQPFENDNNAYNHDDIFVVPEEKARQDAIASSKGSISAVDPCGPILTTLLSENGIIPGLCNLGRNEKVVLQGDITVSKKYFNKENAEVVEPLYVIRENTEIKALKENV